MQKSFRWSVTLSLCFLAQVPNRAYSKDSVQNLAAREEQLLQSLQEPGEGSESFLSEWVAGEETTLFVKAILFLKKDLWTLWVNDREIESTPEASGEQGASLDVFHPVKNPHISVGEFDVEILSVQPKLVTARCQNQTFSLRVGKPFNLATDLTSPQSASEQK